jgi:hypothetical protein
MSIVPFQTFLCFFLCGNDKERKMMSIKLIAWYTLKAAPTLRQAQGDRKQKGLAI